MEKRVGGLAIFLLSILALSCNQFQQLSPSPSEAFFKIYGGAYEQQAADMIQAEDGGFFLFGSSSSFRRGENWDFFLVRTDADGNEIWNKNYDFGGQNDTAKVIIPAYDGGYILGGTSTDAAGNPIVSLIKVDINGTKVDDSEWTNSATWIGSVEDIVKTADNSYLFIGSTPIVDPFKAGEFPPEIEDSEDILVVKIDQKGNEIWRKVYGYKGVDHGVAIEPMGTSGFALLGTTNFPQNRQDNQDHDMVLILINQDGNPYNTQNYGIIGEEVAADLARGNDGSFAIFGTKDKQPLFQKVSETLASSSPVIYEGIRAQKVIPLPSEGYLLVGTTVGGIQNGEDILFMEIDGAGGIIWENEYGSKEDDIGTTAIPLAEGGYALMGTIGFGANTMIGLFKINQSGELLPQ